MSPWWAAVGPASAVVACGPDRHRLRWEAGRLWLDDHDDAEAERALGALGGAPLSCLRLAAAWEARAGDVGLVTLGRRPGEAGLGLGGHGGGAAAPPAVAAALAPRPGPSPPAPAPGGGPAAGPVPAAGRRDELLALLALPAAMIDRLVLTAFARAAQRWPDEQFRLVHGLRLGAALSARATPALGRLGGLVAGGAPVVVHCAPAAPGQAAVVEARRAGSCLHVTAALALGWVPSVWGAGISEPGGGFVLSLVGDGPAGRPGDAVAVEVAAWEPAGPGRWVAAGRRERLVRDGDGLLRPA